MSTTVADQMVETLYAAGVKRIWGIVGDSLNGFTAALRDHGKIAWMHVRHEEVAAFAAAGEAHITGELAVCAGSCGPGNTHLINGLYDCHRSRQPVLAIAAQIPGPEIGSGFFQETHPERLFAECSSYCELVSEPDQMPRVLEIAIRRAISERCVCVVVIPGNIMLEAASKRPTAKRGGLVLVPPVVRPADDMLDALAAMLDAGDRVTLLCGSGCAGVRRELMRLAEVLQSPIVHALRGKEHVESDNPYDVGMTGLIGFSSGYEAMADCDTLLMLGTDFPYQQFYPTKARIAQVDIRAEAIGRRTPIELGVLGDIGETIRGLLDRLTPKTDNRHLSKARKHYAKAREALDDLATEHRHGRIHPQQIARALSDHAAADAVFTCDVGLPTVWAARYLKMGGGRRLIGSFWHGSMANAMPHALGAQAAAGPSRQVISLSGDGGFTMLMGDLLSARQLAQPIKVVIFNNGSLGFVELEQKSTGFVPSGTELANPDFAAMAEAVGIKGIRIEDPALVDDGIAAALAHPGPVVVDAVVDRYELAMPPQITTAMAKGFTLYMVKAVLNGRTDEVFDLAKHNLFR